MRQIRHDQDGQVYVSHQNIITDKVWEGAAAQSPNSHLDWRDYTKLAFDQELEVID